MRPTEVSALSESLQWKSGLDALKAIERAIEKDPGAFARTVCESRKVFIPLCEKALQDALAEVKKKVKSRSELCNFLFCLGDIFGYIGVIECFETERFMGVILDIVLSSRIDIKSRRCAETILLAFIEHDGKRTHRLLQCPVNFRKVLSINAAISSRSFGNFTLQDLWIELFVRMKALLSKTKNTTALKELNESLPRHFWPAITELNEANFSDRIRHFLMAVNRENPFVRSYSVKEIYSELYWQTPTDEIRIGDVDWLDLGIEAISFKVEIAASNGGDNDNQITMDNNNQIEAIDFCIAYEQMKDVRFMKRGMSVRFNYICGENCSPYHAAILKVPKGIHPRLRIFIKGNPATLREIHEKWLELQSLGHIDCDEEETPDLATHSEKPSPAENSARFKKCSVVSTRGYPLQSSPLNVDMLENNVPATEVDKPLKWQSETAEKVSASRRNGENSTKASLENYATSSTIKTKTGINKTERLLDLALEVCTEVSDMGKKGKKHEKPMQNERMKELSKEAAYRHANEVEKFHNARQPARRYETRGAAKNGGLGLHEDTQSKSKKPKAQSSSFKGQEVFSFDQDYAANKTKEAQQVEAAHPAVKQKKDSLTTNAKENIRKPPSGKLELVKKKNAGKPPSGKLELVVVPKKANTKPVENGQEEASLTEKNLKALDDYVEATEGRDSPLSRLSPPDLSQQQNVMKTKGTSGLEGGVKASDERILKTSQKESSPHILREISTPPPCHVGADQGKKGRVSRSMSALKEKNHHQKKSHDYHTDAHDDNDTEDEETDIVGTLLKLYLKRSQKGERELSKARSTQAALLDTITLTAEHIQSQDSILRSLESEVQDCIACLTSTSKNIALKRELLHKDNEEFVSGLKRGREKFDEFYDEMEKEKEAKRSRKNSIVKEKKILQSVINVLQEDITA